ncbi:MAG: hypothetical protein QOF73_4999 [Thermomicrobiales bacterium]|jgi:hypothetical protein|nr:hypothetical protein [Thermomicrobiales bacterium]
MTFDTNISVAVRDDLPTWQRLNMTAFLVSGIAAVADDVVGEDCEDASGNRSSRNRPWSMKPPLGAFWA